MVCKGISQRTLSDPAPKACPTCHKMFTPHRKRPDQKYCGHSCAIKANQDIINTASKTPEAIAKIAAQMRGRGEGKAYSKINGRHAHRVIAEQMLGRPLAEGEIVKFRDGNKQNIDPDNLVVFPDRVSFLSQPLSKPRTPREYCNRGHKLDGENLRVKSNGDRYCATCAQDWWRLNAHQRRVNEREGSVGRVDDAPRRDVIDDLFRMQRSKCAYCRVAIKRSDRRSWNLDHIHPIAKGGDNRRSNLQITCRECNARKSAKDPIEFARSMGKLI